jgi:putative sterol carrier protein
MTPETFFRKLVPDEWNRRLAAERERGDAARLAKLAATSFALEARVRGDGGGSFHLAVDAGSMRVDETAAASPLVTLVMDVSDWRRLAEEVGPSPMALLGGVGGDRNFALTGARIAALRAISGNVRLEVTGAAPWGILVAFGGAPESLDPHTTISIDGAEYRKLREGALDLQGAFMTGKLALSGDVDKAMKLALALMTPE